MKTLTNARAIAASNLNFDLQGTTGGNLNQTQFFQLEAEMAKVVMNDKDNYTPATVTWASTRTTVYTPQSLGLAEGAGIFAGEVVNQASKINDAVNPFAEANRGSIAGTVKGLLYTAAVVAVIFYLSPYVIKNFAKTKAVK